MSTLDSMEWLQGQEDEQRRRFRHALTASGLTHVLLVTFLWFAPEPEPLILPRVITVDLVAALPAPRAPETPKTEAPPAPPAAKPKPKPKVKILPKVAPTPVAKPRPVAKVAPKPVVEPRERPKELSYDDALAKLRGDLGEDAPAPPAEPVLAKADVQPAATTRRGMPVSKEVAAWNLAVMRHIRSVWITPPEFRESGLAAWLEIDVAADGRVLGDPELKRSSGNPFFDDNAIRAVVRASPLPPAPKAGRRTIIFTSEE